MISILSVGESHNVRLFEGVVYLRKNVLMLVISTFILRMEGKLRAAYSPLKKELCIIEEEFHMRKFDELTTKILALKI